MKYQVINIDIDYEKIGTKGTDFNPYMSVYLPENSSEIDLGRKRPTMLICPGGGYSMTSDREAEPVAFKFLAADCNVIILRYDVAPVRFPAQLIELAFAIAKVREMAQEWNVDTEKIAVMGFSAGGHLAASYGVHWNKDFITDYFGFKNHENKPNAMVLCYPVITSGEKAHRGSFENLLGENSKNAEMLELVSVEKQVNQDTPKAFIWHTFEDNIVPVENSLYMASALRNANIETEMHIFPKGYHGLSLCNDAVFTDYHGDYTEVQPWIDMAIRWFKAL
jgi:acetyl esterase/lipase